MQNTLYSFLNFLNHPVSPRLRLGIFTLGGAAIVALGLLRIATDAEFAFASFALFPVVAVSWFCSLRSGLVLSSLSALMWLSADLYLDRQFSSVWVIVVNGLTWFITYGLVSLLAAKVKFLLAREKEMSSHDALTGLLNRRAFYQAGDAEVSRSRRYRHGLAVAFMDLDNFKRLNDQQGHKAGDLALKAVAVALHSVMRTTDLVARVGGDEFAVLLPEIGYDAAVEAGAKLAHAVDATMKGFPPVSASVGVAWFEQAEVDFQAMVHAADELMYEIKRDGKHDQRIRRCGAERQATFDHS